MSETKISDAWLVAWQSRFVGSGDSWRQCSREHYDMVRTTPAEWMGYEVRALHEFSEDTVKAWAKGYAQGVADERTSEANIGIAGFNCKVEPARENPYLAETGKQQVGHTPVDFYVCDSCDHYYMEDGVICDCTTLAKQPPLRHVRMVAATEQQVGDIPTMDSGLAAWLTARGLMPDADEQGCVEMDNVIEALNEHERQLAPEQQVGEVQGAKSSQMDPWSIAEMLRTDLDRQSCPDAYMRIAMESVVKHLTTVQPVGEKWHSPLARVADAYGVTGTWEQIAEAIIAARQPVGESIQRTLVWDRPGELSAYGKDIRLTMLDANGATLWCRTPTDSERIAIAAGQIPHADTPPAQAVDLGQFIALAKFGEEFAFSAEKQPHSRVVYSQASRLLALIDGQAVQHGN